MEQAPPLYPLEAAPFKQNLTALQESLRHSHLPTDGLSDTESHLKAISNAVIHGSSPSFFGFVTGGVTPAAAQADQVVSSLDANAGVPNKDISITANVEDAALRWLLELFKLPVADFQHRVFTTGATASNILGLACARDFIISKEAERQGKQDINVPEYGLHGALHELGIEGIQILTAMPHSSLRKAASLVGLGRGCFVDTSLADSNTVLDIAALERKLANNKMLSIIAVSCAEVDAGRFATDGPAMKELRRLADLHYAWIHVDAAFGLSARCLDPEPKYKLLTDGVAGLEYADSIGSDGHKLLNVPYDCGIFFSKHLAIAQALFANTGAAYLTVAPGDEIPSAMNIGIENSRRFRALPVYASLRTYGASGYKNMVERMIQTARLVARWIDESDKYVLLPQDKISIGRQATTSDEEKYQDIFMVVLFRAVDEGLNDKLAGLINDSRKVWMSGTAWNGEKAVRIAVANWQVVPERESGTIIQVLEDVANSCGS